MKFNALKFYKENGIDFAESGHKRCRDGWVQIDCPFCIGHKGFHLGFYKETGAYKCWRCGKHSQVSVVSTLLNISAYKAKEVIKEYSVIGSQVKEAHRENLKRPKHSLTCKLPAGTGEMTERHKKYLSDRGFNPDELAEKWGLKGTTMNGNYKWRVIVPITFEGKLVSYQGRDITGKSSLRYKACKQADEVIEHQNIVYGLDHVTGNKCVIVEGVADVWRFGYGAVSCFGTAFTLEQVNLLIAQATNKKRKVKIRKYFILFDADEPNAIKMGEKLANMLSSAGLEVELLDLSDTKPQCLVDPEKGIDPANLKQRYADIIKRELEL